MPSGGVLQWLACRSPCVAQPVPARRLAFECPWRRSIGDTARRDNPKMVRNPAPRTHAGQRRSHRPMRHAHTLIELTITLALMSLVLAIAMPPLVGTTERWRLRAAAADVVNALVLTREAALARGTTATFVIDLARGEVRVTCGADTIARRAIAALHGVTLAASGDSVRFGPDGLASGVSNITVLIVRGARVDSVVVSRLGRIRWTGN